MKQRVDTGLAANSGASNMMGRTSNSTAERLKYADPQHAKIGVLNALPVDMERRDRGYVQPGYERITSTADHRYQKIQRAPQEQRPVGDIFVPGNEPPVKSAEQLVSREESNADQINGNIFLGNSKAAQDGEWLRSVGITNVVNTAGEIPNFFPNNLRYFNLGLKDNPRVGDEDLLKVLEPSFRYITAVIKFNPKAKILVHCHLGISRSSSVVIYYLMRTKGWSFDQSLEYTRSKRPIVSPNQWYAKQLKDVEGMLRR